MKLFKPRVTLAATCTTVAAIALAVATTQTPLADLFGKELATKVVDVSLIVAAVCGAVAGAGRSFIPTVDDPTPGIPAAVEPPKAA